MTARQIVAIGGGALEEQVRDYVLGLTGSRPPRVLWVGTASAEDPRDSLRIYDLYAGLAEVTRLEFFPWPPAGLRELVLEHDIVVVGGGNTVNMLAIWRAHGFDRVLREAWEAGVVLTGSSAGMICWFESGVTDSFGPQLAAIRDGLGLLPGSCCPHYDDEELRRPVYRGLVDRGELPAGDGGRRRGGAPLRRHRPAGGRHAASRQASLPGRARRRRYHSTRRCSRSRPTSTGRRRHAVRARMGQRHLLSILRIVRYTKRCARPDGTPGPEPARRAPAAPPRAARPLDARGCPPHRHLSELPSRSRALGRNPSTGRPSGAVATDPRRDRALPSASSSRRCSTPPAPRRHPRDTFSSSKQEPDTSRRWTRRVISSQARSTSGSRWSIRGDLTMRSGGTTFSSGIAGRSAGRGPGRSSSRPAPCGLSSDVLAGAPRSSAPRSLGSASSSAPAPASDGRSRTGSALLESETTWEHHVRAVVPCDARRRAGGQHLRLPRSRSPGARGATRSALDARQPRSGPPTCRRPGRKTRYDRPGRDRGDPRARPAGVSSETWNSLTRAAAVGLAREAASGPPPA